MTPVEIAAYIGAAAWLPQIGSWVYKTLVVPKVTIVPDSAVSIGYTTFGPIFNLNLAISAERKEAILDKLEVVIRHEDGAEHTFLWDRLQEEGFEMSNLEGERIDMKRSTSAIALVAPISGLAEKFVLFQERRFHEARRPHFNSLLTRLNYLKSNVDDSADQAVASEQFHNLVELYRSEFWWKAGRYTISFKATSPRRVSLRKQGFRFDLQQHEVDGLRSNLDDIRSQLVNSIRSGETGYKSQPVNFNWFEVEVTKS